IVAVARADRSADGVVEHKHFIDPDAAFVTGEIAGIAAIGKMLRARRILNSRLQQPGSTFGAHGDFRMASAEAANQPLRDNATYGRGNLKSRDSQVQQARNG